MSVYARAVMEAATKVLLAWTRGQGWPEFDGQPTPRTLNHGRCVDWAELVCARVPGAVLAEWDDPQSELLHTFVVYGGRCYDAECLDGAADVTGLPIFTWWVEEGRVPDPS